MRQAGQGLPFLRSFSKVLNEKELLDEKQKEEMKQAKLKSESKERDDDIESEIKELSKSIKKKKKHNR